MSPLQKITYPRQKLKNKTMLFQHILISLNYAHWIRNQQQCKDKLITSMDRTVLSNSGKVSHIEAETKAFAEYVKYQIKTLSPVEKSYLNSIRTVQKKVEKKTKEHKNKPITLLKK